MSRHRDDWTSARQPISIEKNGVKHEGNYQVEAGMIRVNYAGASKTTQLGGLAHAPEILAQTMLGELVREA